MDAAGITLTPEHREFNIFLNFIEKKFNTTLIFKNKAVLYLPVSPQGSGFSWWIIMDNTTEISCMKSNDSSNPSRFRIVDAPAGRYRVDFELMLSEPEAKALFANIKGLLSGSNFTDTATEIDKSKVWLHTGTGNLHLPNHSITYLVKSYAFQYPSNVKPHKPIDNIVWGFTSNKRKTRKAGLTRHSIKSRSIV